MPKKKATPVEALEQSGEALLVQAGGGEDFPAEQPKEEPPQALIAPDDGPPDEAPDGGAAAFFADASDLDACAGGDASEPLDVDVSPPDDGQSAEGQEPTEEIPAPTWSIQASGVGQDAAPAPAPPLTERQSFFALDFHELDRGLSPEERQAWNSIYASFRGRSALSGQIIGAARPTGIGNLGQGDRIQPL